MYVQLNPKESLTVRLVTSDESVLDSSSIFIVFRDVTYFCYTHYIITPSARDDGLIIYST